MTTIIHLPDEVIVVILENKNISVEDIVNLKYTCKRLQHITFSTTFWKKKYYQRFSLSKVIYNKERSEKVFNHVEAGVKLVERLRHYVSLLSCNNLRDTEETKMSILIRFITEHSIIYNFVYDDINRIISTQLPRHDLTFEYYLILICRWLKQYRLVYKYTKFMSLPEEKLLLERFITIIAQYFQPCISYSIIDSWLNNIVQEVLSCLINRNPIHPVFSTPPEQFTFWRDNNINDNFWNPMETEQIKCIIEEIIFSEFSIRELYKLLVTFHIKEEFINYILEHFQECLLPIMYHIINRRLGLRCFLKHKSGFLVANLWELKNFTDVHLSTVEYFYIMKSVVYPFNIIRGLCTTVKLPLQPSHNISEMEDLIVNISQFVKNSDLCTDLQMQHQMSYKWEIMYMIKFLSLYLGKNIQRIQIINDYEYTIITRSIKDRSNIINGQSEISREQIKFVVGTIVTYLPQMPSSKINNSHDGVIIGWHYSCEVMFVQKNLNLLFPHIYECCKNHTCFCTCHTWKSDKFIRQPHYIILAENNIICYAPQDMVHICPPKWINNIEIGRYFSKFTGNYFVANENLSRKYPPFMQETFHDKLETFYTDCCEKIGKYFNKCYKEMFRKK